ncbi:MAG: hypothetical protein AAB481_02720, partial [Patescibacteria group bacterium]
LAQTGLIKGRKVTLTAGDYLWGLEYYPGNSLGNRWSSGASPKGNVIVEATILGDQFGYEITIQPVGFAFQWWQELILVILAILGFISAYKIGEKS